MSDSDIAKWIRELCPESYEEFLRICELEREVDKICAERMQSVIEASPTIVDNSFWDNRSSLKKLRLFVYHIPQFNSTSFADRIQDWKHRPPQTHILRIQGLLLNSNQKVPFSNFFSRIQVFVGDETYEWDRETHVASLGKECDGLELFFEDQEIDRNLSTIKILFFPCHSIQTYTLSNALSRVVGTSEAPMQQIMKGIVLYAHNQMLLDKTNPGTILLDGNLKVLFGDHVSSLHIANIKNLLTPHLTSPRPVEIIHHINFSNTEWIETEASYDFLMPFNNYKEAEARVKKILPSPSKNITESSENYQNLINKLLSHAQASKFYEKFTNSSPKNFFDDLFYSHHHNLPLSDLSEENVANLRSSEFYKRPWVTSAATQYLNILYGNSSSSSATKIDFTKPPLPTTAGTTKLQMQL